MNRAQRMKNRNTAVKLRMDVTPKPFCNRCGEFGQHYYHDPLPSIGGDCSGWTCDPLTTPQPGKDER